MEEQLLKSTTRHIRIFPLKIGMVNSFSNHVLTLDVDPDNEFNWNEDVQEGVSQI